MKTYTEKRGEYTGTIEEIIADCINNGYRSIDSCTMIDQLTKISEGETKAATLFVAKDTPDGGLNIDSIKIVIQ